MNISVRSNLGVHLLNHLVKLHCTVKATAKLPLHFTLVPTVFQELHVLNRTCYCPCVCVFCLCHLHLSVSVFVSVSFVLSVHVCVCVCDMI